MPFHTVQKAHNLILEILEGRHAHHKTAENVKRQLGGFCSIQNLVQRNNPDINVNNAVMKGHLTHVGEKRLFNGTLLLKRDHRFLKGDLRALLWRCRYFLSHDSPLSSMTR